MKTRFIAGLVLLVVASACGGTPTRPPIATGIEDADDAIRSGAGELCPETTSTRFVLYYDATAGEVYPQSPDTFPVGGQQVVVCVLNSDWRDVYRVGTSEAISLDSGSKGPAFEVGPPVPESYEAVERVAESQAVSLQRQCGGRSIANTVALIEQLRSELLERIRTTFEVPVTPQGVRSLRSQVQALRSPPDSRFLCTSRPEDAAEQAEAAENAEGEGQTRPSPAERRALESGEEARCSLEQYINFYALPDWLWLVGGQIYLDLEALRAAGCAPAPEGGTGGPDDGFGGGGGVAVDPASDSLVPPGMRPLLVSLLRAIAKASALVEFSETIMRELNAPQRIFDLGGFDDNTLVSIHVSHYRRVIEYENGALRSAWTERRSLRRQEIHSLSYFRVEPGFMFSTLRRPKYSIGSNDIGDRVIRIEEDGFRVFHPGVLVSFYWCGTDLRYSPFRRVCHAHQDSFLGHLLPLLPTPAIGIPIDDTLVSGTGSIFLGGLLNWFPYVSIGVGAHLGLNIPTLRGNFRVGDPVPFESTDVSAVTETTVQAGPYISLTIANDAFEALTGFQAAR